MKVIINTYNTYKTLHLFYLYLGMKAQITLPELQVTYEIKINQIIIVFMLFRVYYLFRYFLYLSDYYCTRANRVSKMFGVYMSMSLNIRSVQLKSPFLSAGVFTAVLLFKFAYILKIVEGPLYELIPVYKIKNMDFRNYLNCIWDVFVTITTGIYII